MLDSVRFQQLCDRLGGNNAASQFTQLAAAYAQPHRAYHTMSHVQDCLRQFDCVQHQANRPDEVEAALWFHDVVYDPHAVDNEVQSATWAVQTLQAAGVGSQVGHRIAALILTTRHDLEPETSDEKLLLDIDLSILGQDADAFVAYEHQIRLEYGWVPETQYRAGRIAVLEKFLLRPAIYWTEFFQVQLETPARENLVRSIALLRTDLGR